MTFPILPIMRTFDVTGGTVTAPAGIDAAHAPTMPPLSVSFPTTPTFPSTVTQGWWRFDTAADALGWIQFDTMLSYLATSGECDNSEPEVILYLWNAALNTLVASSSSGTDEYGNTVPRGTIEQLVGSFWASSGLAPGETYYLQAVADVYTRFVLRVSDYGVSTGWETIPDQTWLTSIPDYSSGFPATEPTIWGPVPTPFIRTTPDLTEEPNSAIPLRGPELRGSFWNSKSLEKGFAYTQLPGTDPDALDCSWNIARQGGTGALFWTNSGLGTAVGPGTPSCHPDGDDPTRENGGGFVNRPLGWKYTSTPLNSGIGGGTQTASWDCYETAYGLNFTELYHYFGASAGFDTNGLIGGVLSANLVFESPLTDLPDLLSVEWALEQTAESTNGEGGVVTPRMGLRAVSYDNATGWTEGLNRDASALDGDPSWHGIDAELGQVVDTSALSAWTAVDSTVLADAQAEEARYVTDASTDTYFGGMLWVGWAQEQLVATHPAASGLDTFAYASFDRLYPRLRLTLRPTTRYAYLSLPVLPPTEVVPIGIDGTPGQTSQHFFDFPIVSRQ